MAEDSQNKTLSEVSTKISKLNGTTGEGLANVRALTETLVAQSKASLDATEAGLASEAEARSEAARARKAKLGATDVNVLNWQKEDGGGMFDTLLDMLKMKFAWGGFGLVGLGAAVVGAITGALVGASAGLVIGFLSMWKDIFKFLGGKLAKLFPNVTQMLKNTFGKGGHIGKFFTSIKTFFTESKAFKTISESFTKFKTALSNFGTKIAKFLKPILSIFSGGGGGAMGPLSKFGKHFMRFFRIFKTFFARLFYPLQIIISLVEGFFEAKDAVGKSKGMMATFFNAIVGFFGGILDGLIFGMLDLIKDGVSWIAGFLGFGDVEKLLDSFSFSDMFNEFLDDIYEWFNLLFSDPVAALSKYFSGLFGGILSIGDFIVNMYKKPLVWLMKLFGWDDAAESTEKFSLKEWVMGKWKAVKDWFTGLLSWGKEAGATEDGGWSFMTFIDSIWTKIKNWFTGLLSWGKEAGATEDGGWSLMKFMYGPDGLVTKIKAWIGNLLTFKGADGKDIGIVDKVIDMFKTMIENIISSVKGVLSSVGGEATEARKYWDFKDTGSKKVDTEKLAKNVANMSEQDLMKLKASMIKQSTDTSMFSGGLDNTKEVMDIIASRAAQFKEGGLVRGTGMAVLHGTPAAPEMVLDNQAASLFMQAAQLLASLYLEGTLLRAEGGTTIMNVVNNTPITTHNNKSIGLMPAPSIRPESPNLLPA